MRPHVFLAALLLLASLVPMRAEEWLPLVKGNYWIYRGPTKWLEPKDGGDGNDAKEGVLTCRMEIMEVVRRGRITAAVLKGYPNDLTWYKPGQPPGQYLIVRNGASPYYLFDDEVTETMEKIRSLGRGKSPGKWLRDGEVWLDGPLTVGKRWGDDSGGTRNMYCWIVEAQEPFDGRAVAGLPSAERTAYEVVYRSTPAHEIMRFVQGVGLVSYTYVHHGTLAETELTLVEAHVQPEK